LQDTLKTPQNKDVRETRKQWQEPELKRRETLPRVTNGFAGSWQP
jgi:hypothetical protein